MTDRDANNAVDRRGYAPVTAFVRPQQMTMTLKDKALELADTLRKIVQCLRAYGIEYTSQLANILNPQVEALFIAIHEERSRSHAADILTDIAPTMYEVNGAATKGDMDIFLGTDLLNRYWDLETIFRESRYSNESL